MGRVLECVGQKANKPFWLDKLRCNIFSAEELIYCVYQNAELIEREMFSAELVVWLEQECAARELADKISRLIAKRAGNSAFAEVLLQELDLTETGKKREFLELISEETTENALQRRLRRAEYFLRKERYVPALKEYLVLLEELNEEDTFVKAEVYHKMGIAKANLFLLEEAEKDFYEAYRLDGKEKHFYMYAAAMRMRMSSSEYIQNVSEISHMKEVTLELEAVVKAAEDEWAENEGRSFAEQKAARQLEGSRQYEEWLGNLLSAKKEEYRRRVR